MVKQLLFAVLIGFGLLLMLFSAFGQIIVPPSESAYCKNNSDCSAISCLQDMPVCNTHTGSCYCGPQTCGNAVCDETENFQLCPSDCLPGCGNSVCDATENPSSCPADCKPECGNLVCEAQEDEISCPTDCALQTTCCEWFIDAYRGISECVFYCAQCGDGVCERGKGEDQFTCTQDCGIIGCGDGLCDASIGEDSASCREDCGEFECTRDAECKNIKSCSYVVGDNYPQKEENVFTVCACKENSCGVELSVTGNCSDKFCSSTESCDPSSPNFCSDDCGTCILPDLSVSEFKTSKPIVQSGEKDFSLEVEIENNGSAIAGEFSVFLYKDSVLNPPAQQMTLKDLFLTRVRVDPKDILAYLKESGFRKGPAIVFLQKEEKTFFTASNKLGGAPLNVNFVVGLNEGFNGQALKHEIDWEGDGVFDFSFSPPVKKVVHVYEKPGLYKATLKTTFLDDVEWQTINVLVLDKPVSISFPIDTQFDCGTQNYFVKINSDSKVDESNFINNEAQVSFSIVCPLQPTAVINASKESGGAPLNVDFDAFNSYFDEGAIEGFEWDFGDGETQSGEKVSHEFTESGVYTVKLTAKSDSGVEGFDTVEINVGLKPTANFTASNTKGLLPLSVEFDASSSIDNDGEIVSYAWDFGDGSGSKEKIAGKVFEFAGEYEVSLSVTDDTGFSSTLTKTINVFSSSKPDVLVKEFNIKKLAVSCNKFFTLDFAIKNIDAGNAGEFKVFLTKESPNALPVQVFDVSSLDSLEEKSFEVPLNSGVVLGSYDFFIVIDPKNSLRESDKLNNIEQFKVEVVLDEICGNDFDDDVDGYVDEGCQEQCYNGLDDDADGRENEGCSEICFNSVDDDGNGLIDDGCQDLAKEIPGNEIDDDKDGFVDEGNVEVCLDEKDNDGDGIVDEGCDWTAAVSSGESSQIFLEEEVPVGGLQTILFSHILSGPVANARVALTSPSGKVSVIETNADGKAFFKVEEEGTYEVKSSKCALAASTNFNGLGFALKAKRAALSFPAIIFGSVFDEFPLLVVLLVVLSLVGGVLSFDRSQMLFEQRARTKSEARNLNIVKSIIGAAAFFIPILANKFVSFEIGMAVAIFEIFVLFLLLFPQKSIQKSD